MTEGESGNAYNISTEDDGMTLGDIAEYIASLAERKVIFDIAADEGASKATFALLDFSKIKKLGFKPMYSVKEGLKRTYLIKKELQTD